jgi:sugar/nucleoside kinase (ribokinase family)
MKILTMCNPLMDEVYEVSDSDLKLSGYQKGTMHLIESSKQPAFLEKLTPLRQLPGGSAANTVRGLAFLDSFKKTALEPGFAGAVGQDKAGEAMQEIFAKGSVKSLLAFKKTPTGVSRILVSKDGERTMLTSLGASLMFDKNDLPRVNPGIFHFTGYLWDSPTAREAVLSFIGSHPDTELSFDLSDPFLVNRYTEDFRSTLKGKLTLLFGNQAELEAFTGKTDVDEIIKSASEIAKIVIMKAGKEGAWVGYAGKNILVKGFPARALDTTGAGDSFAAGFLSHYLDARPLVDCAAMGNFLASKIVEVHGCDYELLDKKAFIDFLAK